MSMKISHSILHLIIIISLFIFPGLCFGQEEFFDHFDNGIIDPNWSIQGLTNDNETGTHLLMTDEYQDNNSGGPLLSTITYHTAYKNDITVEVKWEDFASNNNTTFHVYLGSSNGNHVAYGLYRTNGNQQIWLYIYENGQVAYNNQIAYTKDHGIFKLKYQSDSKVITAYYKENEEDSYITYPGGVFSHSNFQNEHWVTFICDNWVSDGPCQLKLDWARITYSTEDPPISGVLNLANDWFELKIDESSGGVMELKNPDDVYNTNFVIGKGNYPQYDIDDSRWLGDAVIQYKKGTGAWVYTTTSRSDDIREITGNDSSIIVSYTKRSGHGFGIRNFHLVEKYRLVNKSLNWTLNFTNVSDDNLEIGDIKLPLPFNQYWSSSQKNIHEQKVFRHTLIALDGSYLYFQRLNGTGPYLVMTPMDGTQLEYYRRKMPGEGRADDIFKMNGPWYEGLFSVYPYSKVEGTSFNPDWFLPHTSITLSPGEEKTIGFTFNWADDYTAIGNNLYNAGLLDVKVFPGMVVPTDHQALMSIHTKAQIQDIELTFPGETQISYLGETRPDHHIYRLTFSHVERNPITVHYNIDRKMVLEFFAIEPVENLIKKRAEFIVEHQQQNDPGLTAYKAFLIWDIINKELVRKENHPEMPSFFYTGTDDLGYGPPLFLAKKNEYFPNEEEISALDDYLNTHIWGHVQDTTHYGLYAYPGESPANPFFRSYNYPHLINIYLSMHQIQTMYGLSDYLSAQEYLLRAYHTFRALFTMTDQVATLGLMGESGYIDLIETLESAGLQEEANWVKDQWEAKINNFAQRDYPYGSEITQDATAYEAVHAMAKYSKNTMLMKKTNNINVANRSWQPVWHNYGSDNRWMGDSHYRLSYMTQLGGWALLDYALNYANSIDKTDLTHKAYGAYLAGWATIHTASGGADQINDGTASWVYHTENGPKEGMNEWTGEQDIGFYGALESASSVVVEDPLFGWVGYGCSLEMVGTGFSIIPKDGLRKRIHIAEPRFSIELVRDLFAHGKPVTIDKDLMYIKFTIESQLNESHTTSLMISGLPERAYEIFIDGKEVKKITGGSNVILGLDLSDNDFYELEITDSSLLGIKEDDYISEGFYLSQNFPNPFNSTTNIKYTIREIDELIFSIYNTLGELILSQKLNHKQPGVYNLNWNGQDIKGNPVSSGIYIYELVSRDRKLTKKMILLQ